MPTVLHNYYSLPLPSTECPTKKVARLVFLSLIIPSLCISEDKSIYLNGQKASLFKVPCPNPGDINIWTAILLYSSKTMLASPLGRKLVSCFIIFLKLADPVQQPNC